MGIGLIGYGHWGPDHARIFNGQPDSGVVFADRDERRFGCVGAIMPFASVTQDYLALRNHPQIGAVAAPLTTRYCLGRERYCKPAKTSSSRSRSATRS
jgi:predicted dehydrogenase